MKLCKSCLIGKPPTEFYASPAHRDGRQSYCKVCARAAKNLWREGKKAREAEYARAWRESNPEQYAANLEEHRHRNREKTYGITRDEFASMLSRQDGKCAVGGHEFGKSVICVDHDHKTGRIRGLLCTKHNLGIGLFDDSTTGLVAAAEYLSGVAVKA